jgi:protein-disulfide isomerase
VKKTEVLMNAAMIVMVLCALAVTGVVVRREFFPARSGGPPAGGKVADWRSYASAGRREGPAAPPVTIVEFEDYQCPYCRAMAPQLDSLRAAMPDRFAIVHRHYPLGNHAFARPAALAAECAGEQQRFREYAAALYAGQDSLPRISWGRLARQVGVQDTARFDACVRSQRLASNVDRDLAAGHRLGVSGTPTFLVNDVLVPGAISAESLAAMIEHAAR